MEEMMAKDQESDDLIELQRERRELLDECQQALDLISQQENSDPRHTYDECLRLRLVVATSHDHMRDAMDEYLICPERDHPIPVTRGNLLLQKRNVILDYVDTINRQRLEFYDAWGIHIDGRRIWLRWMYEHLNDLQMLNYRFQSLREWMPEVSEFEFPEIPDFHSVKSVAPPTPDVLEELIREWKIVTYWNAQIRELRNLGRLARAGSRRNAPREPIRVEALNRQWLVGPTDAQAEEFFNQVRENLLNFENTCNVRETDWAELYRLVRMIFEVCLAE